jgi:membrane protease YdiL (CAAX protease family)
MGALTLLLTIPVLMWSVQALLLWRAGCPQRLRISAPDLPRPLKRVNRVATKLIFGLVLGAYPLLRGVTPWSYYAPFVDLRVAWPALWGCAAGVLYLAALYVAWLATDNMRFYVRHTPARLARRLAGVPFTALFIALVEELLFRALLLAALLETLPAAVAVGLGALVFAVAHYVRSVKRYWTFGGHVALGLLFCLAFYFTGTIWLSLGLHFGGVLMLMAVRPFIRYRGPAWLVGASIFPYAGAVGLAALFLLMGNVWLTFTK